MKRISAGIVTTIASLALAGSALATQEIYKEFKVKESEAKCKTCHVAAMPKKGASDLNDFGKTVQAAKGKDGKIDWTKVTYKAPAPGVAP